MPDENGYVVIRNIVLNLADLGLKYKHSIELIIYDDNSSQDLTWAVELIYNSTMNSLICLLSKHPHEVIEGIKYIPDHKEIESIILSLDPEVYNNLILVCKENLLEIYLYIYNQYKPNEKIITLPTMINIDNIIVKEITKDMDLINSMVIYREG